MDETLGTLNPRYKSPLPLVYIGTVLYYSLGLVGKQKKNKLGNQRIKPQCFKGEKYDQFCGKFPNLQFQKKSFMFAKFSFQTSNLYVYILMPNFFRMIFSKTLDT